MDASRNDPLDNPEEEEEEQHAPVRLDPPQTMEQIFRKDLKEQGLELVEMEGDGNCLFRAIALQVYGDVESHLEVRNKCMDFMVGCCVRFVFVWVYFSWTRDMPYGAHRFS